MIREKAKYLLTKFENSLILSNISSLFNILKNISIIHITYTTLLNLLKKTIVNIINNAIIIKSTLPHPHNNDIILILIISII